MTHGNLVQTLKAELDEILRIFKSQGEIVASPMTYIPTDFLNACRIKLIAHQSRNVGLLSFISHYIHAISLLHKNLDIMKLSTFKGFFEGPETYAEGVNSYFDKLNEQFERIEDGWNTLNTLLPKEISKHSQGKVDITTEFDKKMQ